jgi:hypothetical protein
MPNNKIKSPVTVQSLIGAREISFYSKCLNSLLNYSEERINLVLHDTDNLSPTDKDCIGNSIGQSLSKLSNSQVNEEKVLDYLIEYPNCQNFRKKSIWGIEFFDPIFEIPDERYSYYIDADILFIKPFNRLFDPNFIMGGAIFLKDTQWDAYSLRPWHLMGIKKNIDVVKGITTALVCWDKSAIDWDFLEWFLGQVRFHKIPEWVMPTAQAALAAQCDAKTVQPLQIMNMYPNAKITKNTFGLHLLGSYREKWLSNLGEYHYSNDKDPVCTQFESCEIQSTIGFSIRQAKRWMNTRLNLW